MMADEMSDMEPIKIFTVGGTIDKVYFDAKNVYEVGEPQIGEVLDRSDVTLDFSITTLCRKDSLELDEADLEMIRAAIAATAERRVLVTHGTDTMARTAEHLRSIEGKTIVLTGASEPARFHNSNAIFNIGCAVAAVQALPDGVYIAMNGRIFSAGQVRKNSETRKFESL